MINFRERFSTWRPAAYDGEFEWDFILPAFSGTKIQPMDIDAMVERKGKFLAFETKIPGKKIPTGQAITLNALLATGCVSVFFLEGKTIHDVGFSTFCPPRSTIENGRRIACDWRYVIAKTRVWFEWANGGRIDKDTFWAGFDIWVVEHFEKQPGKGEAPSVHT